MADNSTIEWTEATWNPLTGCTKVSPGCDHCYAETFAERFRGVPGHHFEQGFDLQLRPERLQQPIRWKRPRRIFVNSMSDLFHAGVPETFIASVFAAMSLAPQHTFQMLTKRHARMRSLLNDPEFEPTVRQMARAMKYSGGRSDPRMDDRNYQTWPLPNVWLGVSVEDQHWAGIRIPALEATPAAVRWISAEPLLGYVRIAAWIDHLDWVVVGGESGPGARPMHPKWARSLRDVCAASGTPFLFKQRGAWTWTASPRLDPWAEREPDAYVAHDGRVLVEGDAIADGGPFQGVWKVGKGPAGRDLDGVTHDGYPVVPDAQ